MIVSMQGKRKWWIVLITLLICAGLLTLFLLRYGGTHENDAAALAGETEEQRVAFLNQYGWQLVIPAEIADTVTIPSHFDPVYTAYNAIQLSQNMDLREYAGKTCQRYSYRVVNCSAGSGTVYATLLVYEGKIIGGDLCDTALDGFQSGFAGPEQTKSTSSTTERVDLPAAAYPID